MRKKPIKDVLRKYSDELMSLPNVNGVCIEMSSSGELCIKVFVTKLTASTREKIPSNIEGYRVEVEEIGEIRAL